jgi:hypothetical protein
LRRRQNFTHTNRKVLVVVLKNMHYSVNTSDLNQAIEELGQTVKNIWNIQHSRTKAPLPMFFIDLRPAVTNKTIYEVEYLLNLKIKSEPPNFKRDITQCANCQRYGHTKRYCNLKPHCVKCAGYHLTTDCPRKERSPNVKCVLCDGNHSANYRGCVVYKDLQKKKSLHLVKTISTRSSCSCWKYSTTWSQLCSCCKHSTIWSQLRPNCQRTIQQDNTRNNTMQPEPLISLTTSNDMTELKHMLKTLMEQMGTMLNLLTTVITKLAK